MKKIGIISLMFLSFITLYQCEMQPIEVTEEFKGNKVDLKIPFKTIACSEKELADDGYNEAIKRLNNNTLFLAEALYQTFQDSDYNQLIFEKYDFMKLQDLPLTFLFTDESFQRAFSAEIESVIANANVKKETGYSSYNDLLSDFIISDVQQEPIIHFINPEVADFSLEPIISAGIQVEDNPAQGIEDCIIAWFPGEEGTKTQILISEDEALVSKWPVYVLTTINKEDEILILSGKANKGYSEKSIKGLKSSMSAMAMDHLSSYEYRIDERYEGSGDSEFCITAYRVEFIGSSGTYSTHWLYSQYSNSNKLIAKVNKNDIGVDLTRWEWFCDNYQPHDDNVIFFNTYERDWWAGNKNLGVISYPGVTTKLYLYGRMSDPGDWYCNDPDDYEWADHVDLSYYNNSWAKTYENDKGKIRIWRID
jgi:hypothetical protein